MFSFINYKNNNCRIIALINNDHIPKHMNISFIYELIVLSTYLSSNKQSIGLFKLYEFCFNLLREDKMNYKIWDI